MEGFVINTLIMALSILIIGKLTKLYELKNFFSALWVAMIMAVLNFFLAPILHILALPITIITLGVAALFVNGLILIIAGSFVSSFRTKGCLSSTLGWILISLLSIILRRLLV